MLVFKVFREESESRMNGKQYFFPSKLPHLFNPFIPSSHRTPGRLGDIFVISAFSECI